MRRLILASLAVATLALAAPSPAPAAGLLRRLFRRPPVQRSFSVQVGGGRGVAIQRSVVRVAPPVVVQQVPVVVQQQIVRQRGFSVRRRGF